MIYNHKTQNFFMIFFDLSFDGPLVYSINICRKIYFGFLCGHKSKQKYILINMFSSSNDKLNVFNSCFFIHVF